jgi:hypothetical protein
MTVVALFQKRYGTRDQGFLEDDVVA